MYNDEKIYSIELGEDLEITDPAQGTQGCRPPAGRHESPASPARPAPKPRPRAESKPPSGGLQFAPLMILTCLLGPFSVHLQSRQQPGGRGLARRRHDQRHGRPGNVRRSGLHPGHHRQGLAAVAVGRDRGRSRSW